MCHCPDEHGICPVRKDWIDALIERLSITRPDEHERRRIAYRSTHTEHAA